MPYWLGMGRSDIPKKGVNHSGEWWEDKKDAAGTVIPFAHPNARYTSGSANWRTLIPMSTTRSASLFRESSMVDVTQIPMCPSVRL